jgi:hypothetical protein
MVQGVAVDDDDRRIVAALVGIAQLGAEDAVARRRLLLDRGCSRRVSLGVGIFTIEAA